MPVTNPCCCGCSLRTGTQIVAIVNIVLSSILCLLFFLGVFGLGFVAAVGTENLSKHNSNSESDYVYGSSSKPSSGEFKNADTAILIVFIFTVIMLLFSVLELISSIVLLVGANQRHHGKCRFWYIVTMVFLILYIIKSVTEIVFGGISGGFLTAFAHFLSFLIGFAITGYQLWVVYAFMEELREGGPVQTAGYVHGPAGGSGPQAYIYTKPGEGPGQMPPPYAQAQEGYVAVPVNSSYPPAPAYPQQAYPPQQQSGFYPKLDAEKGQNY